MKELTETNDKLAAVRKAQAAAAKLDDLLQHGATHFEVGIKVKASLSNWHNDWPHGVMDDRLDEALIAGFRANFKVALSVAYSALRAEEKRLCEELVRLAAKTAAGGL